MTQRTITVYTKEDCVQCNSTKRVLDRAGAVYEEVDITPAYDPKAAGTPEQLEALAHVAAMKELGLMSAPVVVVSNPDPASGDFYWAGFRPDLLKQLCVEPA